MNLNLERMPTEKLTALRAEIDEVLAEKISEEKAELQAKLDKLAEFDGGGRGRGGRSGRPSSLKGGKIAAHYRGPEGETWSGRGLKPKWLTALLADGHDIEEYALSGAGDARKAAKRRGRPAKK